MANQSYSLDFKLFLEGVEIPFNGVSISITPNGSNANFNIYSNFEAQNLKPKTAVQVFYRDFIENAEFKDGKPTWRLMFNGYTSGINEFAQKTQGRAIQLVARDFRADIAKIPATVVYKPIGVDDLLSINGITMSFFGLNEQYTTATDVKVNMAADQRVYSSFGDEDIKIENSTDASGFINLDKMLAEIAGTASGKKSSTPSGNDMFGYDDTKLSKDAFKVDKNGMVDGALFLDSLARGLFLESTAGTTYGGFVNKRLRADKKMMILANGAGYRFYSAYRGGGHLSESLAGSAQLTSIEALIMRVAALFQSRVYSCSTPSYIRINKDSSATGYVVDDVVRDFIEQKDKNFGDMAVLNEAMILPPLEFTAPPNCNLILPSMYDNVNWRYDYDVDKTRGLYHVAEIFDENIGAGDSQNDLGSRNIQFPTAITDFAGSWEDSKSINKYSFLSMAERYAGVNMTFGDIVHSQAWDDADASAIAYGDQKLIDQAKAASNEIDAAALKAKTSQVSDLLFDSANKFKIMAEKAAFVATAVFPSKDTSQNIEGLKRHAAIKFVNERYMGRVCQVSMMFNPYIMCGYPAIVVGGIEDDGSHVARDVIGMVQQITHTISKVSGGCEANTSVVLSMPRYIDEPTAVGDYGQPLYLEATNPRWSELKKDSGIRVNPFVPEAVSPTIHNVDRSSVFAVNYNVGATDKYLYAKDFLSTTEGNHKKGILNRTYIDEIYEPQNIHKFYRDVFGMDSFMVDSYQDKPGSIINFSYNSIHEALVNFKHKYADYIFGDYAESTKLIYRKICSPDELFCGVHNLSVLNFDEEGKPVYKVKDHGEFDATDIRDNYYGISTSRWDRASKSAKGISTAARKNDILLKKLLLSNGGHMEGPGEFSSIGENYPLTAFIKERRTAVISYLRSITSQFNFVRE